jgi:hypothetical protein
MNLNRLLRKDFTRLFRGADPLDYIQDIRIEEIPDETRCVVIFKVPQVPPYFVARPDVYGAFSDPIRTELRRMTEEAIAAATLGEFNWRGSQKAPDPKPEVKKIDPMEAVDFLKPKKIIYSGPKTIVFWPDGTKTKVSLMKGHEHDEYGAFCAAVVKKMFGATHKAKKFLESVAVRPEPKPKKVKEDKYAHMETMPMPGTEDPNWGQKHWAPETLEEDTCNG